MSKRGRGRPSKLTPDVRDRLLNAIATGNYYEAACRYAGIGYSTFRMWVAKGEGQETGEYREFVERLKKAESDAEVRMVAQWQSQFPNANAVNGGWQAIATFLERRYPERWARRHRIEASGPDGGPIQTSTAHLTREELDKLPTEVLEQLHAAVNAGKG